MCYFLTSCRIEFLLKVSRVIEVAAGANHTLILLGHLFQVVVFLISLVDIGEIYSWGRGEKGRLGHGTERDIFYPKKISGYARVHFKAIAASITHFLKHLPHKDTQVIITRLLFVQEGIVTRGAQGDMVN